MQARLAGGLPGQRSADWAEAARSPPRHHATTLTARMPGVTTKELMAHIGHASPRAALRYQHATAESDRAIAAFLDDQIKAEHRDERAPIMPLPAARPAGAESEP
jgi:hypothetical protein